MIYPRYIPDLAPSKHHLLHLLQYSLNGVKSKENRENRLAQFFIRTSQLLLMMVM